MPRILIVNCRPEAAQRRPFSTPPGGPLWPDGVEYASPAKTKKEESDEQNAANDRNGWQAFHRYLLTDARLSSAIDSGFQAIGN